jgi:hypothetical protein
LRADTVDLIGDAVADVGRRDLLKPFHLGPVMWHRVFQGDGPRVQAAAVAANTGLAAFAVGTRLASLRGSGGARRCMN